MKLLNAGRYGWVEPNVYLLKAST